MSEKFPRLSKVWVIVHFLIFLYGWFSGEGPSLDVIFVVRNLAYWLQRPLHRLKQTDLVDIAGGWHLIFRRVQFVFFPKILTLLTTYTLWLGKFHEIFHILVYALPYLAILLLSFLYVHVSVTFNSMDLSLDQPGRRLAHLTLLSHLRYLI